MSPIHIKITFAVAGAGANAEGALSGSSSSVRDIKSGAVEAAGGPGGGHGRVSPAPGLCLGGSTAPNPGAGQGS